MFSQRDVDRAYTRAPFLAKPLLSIFLPHHGRTMEQSTVFFLIRHASFRRPFIYFIFFQIGSRTVWPDWKTSGNLSISIYRENTGRNDNDDRISNTFSYVNLWEF